MRQPSELMGPVVGAMASGNKRVVADEPTRSHRPRCVRVLASEAKEQFHNSLMVWLEVLSCGDRLCQGQLTAVLATRHEIFLVDPFPTIRPYNALTRASREKRFGVLWGLDLCELGAAKVPNTDLESSCGSGFLSNAGVVADHFGSGCRRQRWHDDTSGRIASEVF